MENHAFLFNLMAFLAAAVIAVPIFTRLGLGSVLGYLVAGSVLGPWGIGLIQDAHAILTFSEFGVVLLLFVIGLELKPSRLWVMRKAIFGMGGAQLLISAGLLTLALSLFGVDTRASLIAAFGLSLSSTAFALQILAEKKELNTGHGRASFAILLFQDLAIVPLLALIPLLGGTQAEAQNSSLFSVGKTVAVVGGMMIGGRYLLRPVFRAVAASRTREVFTGAVLLIVVGAAVLMEATGLSMALGTFLAGVLLADSEYRHQIEADIEPFKGLLLGLFFMAVGMSVDYGLLLKHPVMLIGIVLGFMILKYAVVYGVARAAKFSHASAKNMAIVLPQGGEFAFVLFGLAVESHVMPSSLADLLVVAVTLSMGLTPLFVFLNERFICPRANTPKEPFDDIKSEEQPVIIAGFGRFGQIVARILRVKNIEYTALEQDPEQVNQVRRFGTDIYYGDASRLDLLEAAGAKKAKYFVLAIDNVESSIATAQAVREHFPHLKIFARARNRQHVYELVNLGVTVIHRETFASSLEMTEQLLMDLGESEKEARHSILKFRGHDERMLAEAQKLYKDEEQLINHSKQSAQQLVSLFRSDTPGSPNES